MALTKIVTTAPGTTAPVAGGLINAAFDAIDRLNGAFVTPEEFGAVGNGVTDDTTAFNSALATGRTVLLSLKEYVVADVVVPNGGRMVAFGGKGYSADTVASVTDRPLLIRKTGAVTCILNVDNKKHFYFEGFQIDGVGRTVPAFSGGGEFGTYKSITVVNCTNGFGGFGAVRANYEAVGEFLYCTAASNDVGFASLVDSHVVGGAAAANGTGVQLQPGADTNNFTGLRVEFNVGYGYDIYQAGNNQITGGCTDRNGKAGISFDDVRGPWTVAGHLFRRNGSLNAALDSKCHLRFNNNSNAAARIVVTGCNSATGTDDGGGGTLSPTYGVGWSSTNSNITLVGNDFAGYVTSGSNGTIGAAPGIRISVCRGLTDQ